MKSGSGVKPYGIFWLTSSILAAPHADRSVGVRADVFYFVDQLDDLQPYAAFLDSRDKSLVLYRWLCHLLVEEGSLDALPCISDRLAAQRLRFYCVHAREPWSKRAVQKRRCATAQIASDELRQQRAGELELHMSRLHSREVACVARGHLSHLDELQWCAHSDLNHCPAPSTSAHRCSFLPSQVTRSTPPSTTTAAGRRLDAVGALPPPLPPPWPLSGSASRRPERGTLVRCAHACACHQSPAIPD